MENLQVGQLAPLIEIVTWDGDLYYLPREREEALKKAMETELFIKIGSETIATKSIKKTRPVMKIKQMLKLNSDERHALELRTKLFQDRLGRSPTETEIQTFISKIQNNED